MRTTTQTSLFEVPESPIIKKEPRGENVERLPRLDAHPELRSRLLSYCRLSPGEIWEDPVKGHRVGVLDATDPKGVERIMTGTKTPLIINDPPYNVVVGNSNTFNLAKKDIDSYIEFSRLWVENALDILRADGSLYVWMGTDYRDNFQPLPDFMILMRNYQDIIKPRNLITMRNQRGYGTQHNWMWIRQELLYYTKGEAHFNIDAEYTDIPKVLRGYYKTVNGTITENLERSKSQNIRAGNVWVDIQQVFYRLEENVPGCYAQKPLKAIERIIEASSSKNDLVVDFFSHSGTTLLGGERLGRRVFTFDIDPIFAELTIRRIENYRRTGRTGWQWHNPFPELDA
jgi:site-specific DNA-methyltransferase (adenine-specific)